MGKQILRLSEVEVEFIGSDKRNWGSFAVKLLLHVHMQILI